MRPLAFLLAFCCMAQAATPLQHVLDRIAEEAEAFSALSQQVLGNETLHQRAVKLPPKFGFRIGDFQKAGFKPNWQFRDIISEYGFALTGTPPALHELRQVIAVDGRAVQDQKQAQDTLAKAVAASGDDQKRQTLQQFARYGLPGSATDFGQLILLFTHAGIQQYEFAVIGNRAIGPEKTLVLRYKQLDGPEGLTVFSNKQNQQTRRLPLEGEVWVRDPDAVPLRIVMTSGEADGSLTEHATVDYAMSPYGAVLPVRISHEERRKGDLTASNQFTYAGFRKFSATSELKN